MKTIAILSQKGGAGKTTLAINLAVAFQNKNKKTAIIDLDPQASASSWRDSREDENPAVVSAQPARLANVLEAAKEGGADIVFIDTAPHAESASLAAARNADYAIIPCRPAILDIKAIGATVDLIRLASIPASVVLNCVPAVGSLADEAKEAVSGYGLPVAPAQIVQRAAFIHSLTANSAVVEYEPTSKAANEIEALRDWLMKQIGMRAR